ncbi:MAG: NADH-quinone oxidoreductase subunit F [Myxococcales bacterium]|nr:NADH-quinone oxidoreductase subunit F [Myxococcales bacterium]
MSAGGRRVEVPGDSAGSLRVYVPGDSAGSIRVYVPGDSAACSVGADETARAIVREAAARGASIELVRNGSRGLLWLEPLVEVEREGLRRAFGPVDADAVPGLFDAGWLEPGAAPDHPLAQGPTDAIPWLASQERVLFARCGVVDPLCLDDYRRHGGLVGLERALRAKPAEIVDEIKASGLRGRGGAGFPAGLKWETVAAAAGDEKFVCCNADEGDSGTFADRLLMEGDPFSILEGMAIAGLAVGATRGFIYLRSEYPHAIRVVRRAIDVAREAGWLGRDVLGSGRAFDVTLRVGAGAYVCGEETAMLESLEGRRGIVRAKPPLPAHAGLFGRPTLVHNVLTLAAAPFVLAQGSAAHHAYGCGRSRGTQPFQLAGNVLRGGLVERGFGVTLRELVEGYGGGTASGRPVRAIQIGGPLGAYHDVGDLDVEMDYERLVEAGGLLGHGGIVVFDDTVDLAEQARFAMAFCAHESCGKCTPCRVGAVRGVEVLDRIRAGEDREANRALLESLCGTMRDASLCAMGGLTPNPVLSALARFPEDFEGSPRAGRGSAAAMAGRQEDER